MRIFFGCGLSSINTPLCSRLVRSLLWQIRLREGRACFPRFWKTAGDLAELVVFQVSGAEMYARAEGAFVPDLLAVSAFDDLSFEHEGLAMTAMHDSVFSR
jgi:hypothetical protein